MKIGLHKKNYGYARVVYGDIPPAHNYMDIPSITLWKAPMLPTYLQWIRVFSPYPRVDLIHTFNHIVLNKVPWVVSFESYLPRFVGKNIEKVKAWRWGLERLAQDECKKILPMSKAAERLFIHYAIRNGFREDDFRRKIRLVYPAVASKRPDGLFRKVGTVVRILFIGNDFFLKGGRILLRAFKKLSTAYDLKLVLISRLAYGDYITHSTEEDMKEVLRVIENDERITLLENVPYEEVMGDHFPGSDIFVLPTMQDTFGFVNIEAMISGLPVITTNLFACPEQVIHDETGYLMSIPLNEEDKLDLNEGSKTERRELIDALEKSIEKQLARYLEKLVQDPDKRLRFGRRGKEIAEEKFSCTARNRELMKIYSEID